MTKSQQQRYELLSSIGEGNLNNEQWKEWDSLRARSYASHEQEWSRNYPCKHGHNNCAIKDGGNCFDEMNQSK